MTISEYRVKIKNSVTQSVFTDSVMEGGSEQLPAWAGLERNSI